MNSALPQIIDPDDLAAHLGVPARTLKKRARELGIGRQLGQVYFFINDDVGAFMEALRPCPSSSTNEAKSGTSVERLPEGNYEALRAQRTKSARKGSRRKPRQERGQVISMDRGRT